jgi:hypothetical protein
VLFPGAAAKGEARIFGAEMGTNSGTRTERYETLQGNETPG